MSQLKRYCQCSHKMYIYICTQWHFPKSLVWLWFIYRCIFLAGSPRGTLDFSVFGGDCVSWTWIMAGRSEDDSVSNSSGESRWATRFTDDRDRSVFIWKTLSVARRHACRLSAICSSFSSKSVAHDAFYFWCFRPSDAPDFWFSLVDLNRGFWREHYLNTSILKHSYPQSAVYIVNDRLIVFYILLVRLYFQFISKMTDFQSAATS